MEIEVTNWNARRDVLKAIRQRVFIDEQGVPEALEWDLDDAAAVHFIARDGKRPIGCARLLANGHFGRMAVIPEYRGHKVGTLLLRAVESCYQREFRGRILKANVQTQAFGFYHNNGFIPEAAFNLDAGIPHISMNKVLGRNGPVSDILLPGKDSQRYDFEPAGAAEGLLQIGSQFGPSAISLMISDPALPLWSDATTLSCLNRCLRSARQRRIYILLATEYAGISDHKLIQLQQRMSSRMEVRVHGGVKANQILMAPWSWVEIKRTQVSACMDDRARVARQTEQFQLLWRNSQPSREAQHLKL